VARRQAARRQAAPLTAFIDNLDRCYKSLVLSSTGLPIGPARSPAGTLADPAARGRPLKQLGYRCLHWGPRQRSSTCGLASAGEDSGQQIHYCADSDLRHVGSLRRRLELVFFQCRDSDSDLRHVGSLRQETVFSPVHGRALPTAIFDMWARFGTEFLASIQLGDASRQRSSTCGLASAKSAICISRCPAPDSDRFDMWARFGATGRDVLTVAFFPTAIFDMWARFGLGWRPRYVATNSRQRSSTCGLASAKSDLRAGANPTAIFDMWARFGMVYFHRGPGSDSDLRHVDSLRHSASTSSPPDGCPIAIFDMWARFGNTRPIGPIPE
jgi:hypothetical protein